MHPPSGPDRSPAARRAKRSARPGPGAWSLPLLLRSTIPARDQPVTRGVPFPQGILADPAAVTLLDATGQEVPVQAEALSRWPDGSVRWLLLDFVISAITAGDHRPARRPPEGPDVEHPSLVASRETPAAFVVDTGPAEFEVERRSLCPFSGAGYGGKPVRTFRSRVGLKDVSGKVHHPPVETSRVETYGPVRTTLLLTGALASWGGGRFTARVCFFAGTGLTRLRLTLHNPNPARHPGGLWDLGDPGSLLFSELFFRLSLFGAEEPGSRWTAEAGQPAQPLQGWA